MARTEEAEAFFHAVYSAIQEIPHGKVTSYSHIARLIGTRKLDFTPQNACNVPKVYYFVTVRIRFLE